MIYIEPVEDVLYTERKAYTYLKTRIKLYVELSFTVRLNQPTLKETIRLNATGAEPPSCTTTEAYPKGTTQLSKLYNKH